MSRTQLVGMIHLSPVSSIPRMALGILREIIYVVRLFLEHSAILVDGGPMKLNTIATAAILPSIFTDAHTLIHCHAISSAG